MPVLFPISAQKNASPAVKYGGSMFCGCFATSGTAVLNLCRVKLVLQRDDKNKVAYLCKMGRTQNKCWIPWKGKNNLIGSKRFDLPQSKLSGISLTSTRPFYTTKTFHIHKRNAQNTCLVIDLNYS